MTVSVLRRISDHEWEIPRSYRADMRGDVRIFATEELLTQIMDDKSLEQAVNATTLPGLVGPVVVMPDMHQGYGFPIGGIAATELPHGAISPGAIGYDINCGVRLMSSPLDLATARADIDELADKLNAYCPSGIGKEGALSLSLPELDRVLRDGSRWALKQGYATEADVELTEESGCIDGADPKCVSDRAKARGREQIGSLGSGNHFLEVDVVDEVFDEDLATAFGLHSGQLAIQIHCGSRGLGHQVCTDYVGRFQSAVTKYGIRLPDRELVCAPIDSPEGQAYLGAMRAAANFAFANRQILARSARRAFEDTFRGKARDWQLSQVYDIAHNMGKVEVHQVGDRRIKVCVHRKGATRAFGPNAPELPPRYKPYGQPVLVPGSMGTASWVLAGTEESMLRSFGSSCHGAGRVWSRSKAKREVRGDQLRAKLEEGGIAVRAGSMSGLAEEAPAAYKDVDAVVATVVAVGIAEKVARLKPIIVIKG
jgi:tRNA-splicing ligase RtcB (3'-phosphate/5'-hydroxy nucleic acid ligase)